MGALTQLVCIAASTAATAEQQSPASHGPTGQSYEYGNDNVLCEVQHVAIIVHDNITAVYNCSIKIAARKQHTQPVNVYEAS